MTLAEAKRILKPPLKFGDDAQIRALKFMDEVETCKEQFLACENFADHFRLRFKAGEEIAAILTYCESGCTFIDADRRFNDDVIGAALRKASREWKKLHN